MPEEEQSHFASIAQRFGSNITRKVRAVPIDGLLLDVRLALRNLRRNVRRTSAAVGTVAFGITAFMLAGGFIAYIFEQIREATIHSQLGHVQVVRPGYFTEGVADPYRFLLPRDASERALVEKTPGFVSLAPRLAFSGLISHGDATLSFIAEGVDPQQEQQLSSGIAIISGRDLVSSSETATVLGEGLARSMGLKPGDRVVLLTTAANGSPGAVEVEVAGTFATMYRDYDERALRLPLAVARKLMKVDGATTWVVLLADTGRTEAAKEYLQRVLSKGAFEVVPWFDLADFYNKTVTLFSKQVSVVKYIIGLLIVLTISNTQTMCVLERTTEIGTSLAIGLRARLVMRLFLVEGVLVGLFGGLAGVVLGSLVAHVVSAIGIPMPPPPGMERGYIGRILLEPGLVVDAFVLAVVTTLLASILPAWKASRMNVVDALRHNQ